MAGSILVFLAIAGGAVGLSAATKRRVSAMLPLSVVLMIVLTFGFGMIGLLKMGAVITVLCFAVAGVATVGLSLRRKSAWRPVWDSALAFFALGFAWIVFISKGRMVLAQEEYTQWALAAKEMYFSGSMTAGDTLAQSPVLAVFETIFQTLNALPGGDGFQDWLLYTAYGTACLALLAPFAAGVHPQKAVRAGYKLLFFLVAVCVPLHAFDLFSALNPAGFLAILAAAAFLKAAERKSPTQAAVLGLYLFTLTLTEDAGLYFALAALAVYLFTLVHSDAYQQAEHKQRVKLMAVPAAFILAARVLWPYVSFSVHEATAGILPAFWQAFTAKSVTYRLALTLGSGTVFSLGTVYVSFLALTIVLAGVSALLLYVVEKREMRAALWAAPAVCVLYGIGLWLAYVFTTGAEDAAKLVNFQQLLSVGYVFWALVVLTVVMQALKETPRWTWPRHLLAVLACVLVILAGSGTVSELSSRDFTADNEKYHTYYAVADAAQEVIPEDASVYIVSQNDDGSRYNALRYALCPRRVNLGATYWLRDPEDKQYTWTYPITPEAWMAALADYGYVLTYQADDYLQTTVAQAVSANGTLAANTLYSVNPDTGLLEELNPEATAP